MSNIKKISVLKENSEFEIPGAKFDQPILICSSWMCYQQCTCQFMQDNEQLGLADQYYATHLEIWE